MKLITFAGPPSSGKTSVIIQALKCLNIPPEKTGIIKFDSLTSFDHLRYKEHGIPVQTGFAGKICPDHFFVSNAEEAVS